MDKLHCQQLKMVWRWIVTPSSVLIACLHIQLAFSAGEEQNYSEYATPSTSYPQATVAHPLPLLNVGRYGVGYRVRHGASYPSSINNNLNDFSTEPQTCGPQLQGPCQESKYRTINGSCNNLINPTIGMTNTLYSRLLPSKYADGVHAPPISVNGSKLPGSRRVSTLLFPDVHNPDTVRTLSTMQWGQIVTHDMSLALITPQAQAQAMQCCSRDGQIEQNGSTVCFPIIIPPDDPFYSRFHQMCMNFPRSTTNIDLGCSTGNKSAEQVVTVTHYMDASLVYGPTPDLAARLREGIGGRLLVEFRDGEPWPPAAANKSAVCDRQSDEEPCYQFGDIRGNLTPQLTALQIILLREHNRIANTLANINPHWDDETLYQESRRILIAEYQHINYYEFLPMYLGRENMLKYGLIYDTEGYTDDYMDGVDPSVLNEHATAAFRYFHSAIQGKLELISEDRHILGDLRLSNYYFRPGIIEVGHNMDNLCRGLVTQAEENDDPFFTNETTDYLFRSGKPYGRDLRAIDIQRGRDHGLASYNDCRHFCGLPKAQSFHDFGDFISAENIEKLKKLYNSPYDVDLVVGGSLEAHVNGTLSGPIFLCVLMEQFYRTRVADRYFYESGNQNTAFSPEQLNEIRKASYSRLVCDNSGHIKNMQPHGFKLISQTNQLVSCDDQNTIPALNLSLWKDVRGYYENLFYVKNL